MPLEQPTHSEELESARSLFIEIYGEEPNTNDLKQFMREYGPSDVLVENPPV